MDALRKSLDTISARKKEDDGSRGERSAVQDREAGIGHDIQMPGKSNLLNAELPVHWI
jgi:hypothetical protein